MAEVHGDEAQEGDQGVVAATLAYLARSLVDHPDDVNVAVIPDGDRTVLRLTVHPEDAGRVIGRGGRVARAIRVVTKAAATREGIPVFVQIGEPRDESHAGA
jgi:hypothetical protein